MHAGSLESAGSPRKRTLSRGVSEDESLRNIIKETESPARRLTRSDSRGGNFKWRSGSQQSDEDQELIMELPEMFDLQASYDDVVQELRGLELQRETLLFQVDVLQDALEGAEEMLAEAQREASHTTMELERERESKRKLEDMVSSLLQAVERLEEEKNTKPAVHMLVREQEMAGQQAQEMDIKKEGPDQIGNAPRDEGSESPSPNNRLSLQKANGEQPLDSLSQPPLLKKAVSGSSVDSEYVEKRADDSFKLNNMTNTFTGPLVLESQSHWDSQAEDGRDRSPDRNNDTDSISAYEDACAETPELDEGDGPRLPHDEGSPVDDIEGELILNGSEPKNPNDSCVLS
ncbi:leucine-rich repeat flightless-interacting protein 2 [Esox lucius]|uniref:leucine-rich repeat flightless-interacting protein 2 n=1 Tax=Esox lucius TaxID=8010 RepID=UPI0014773AEB|nr:leucine-rich repeat flightless-interacting protein 2 [Esox lucius]